MALIPPPIRRSRFVRITRPVAVLVASALALAALVAAPTAANADPVAEFSISGTVVDSHQSPLSNVGITIATDDDARTEVGYGTTAADGTYTTDPVPHGTYLVTYSLDGYASGNLHLSVSDQNLVAQDVTLGDGARYTVSGTVTSDADDISGLIATLLRPISPTETQTISTTTVNPTTGAFTLPGLSPDFSYKILISDPSGAFAPTYYSDEGGTDVYVGNANGTDYDVDLASGTFVAAGVSISGGTALGDVLTASASFSPVGTYSYQWLRDGAPIAGATAPTYALTAADQGTSISVIATAVKRAVETSSAESAVIAVPAAIKAFANVKNPKISGKAKVGKVLKTTKVDWNTTAVKVTYKWYANGKLIKKATKSSLKLTKKLASKKITVKVTGTKIGYETITKSSKATGKVKK